MTNEQAVFLKSRLGGGFEAADPIMNQDGIGKRIDSHKETDHDILVNQDYEMLDQIGFHKLRDGIQWYLIERKKGRYNFNTLDNLVDAANRHKQQVIFDFLHYGTPDHTDVTSPDFPERFGEFSKAAATRIRERNQFWGNDEVPIYCPTNEISYFSFAYDQHHMYPKAKREGVNVKHQLIKANIACKKAVLEVDPRARFIDVDPMINIVAHPNATMETRDQVANYNNSQFEAWDMIAGRMWPELGGKEEYLDIIGANFYYNGQWIHGANPQEFMEFNWHEHHKSGSSEKFHKEWMPLSAMLERLHHRYNRPIYISETGHFRERRGHWMDEINSEMQLSIQQGTPLIGACLYPVIDRYDWDPKNKHLHNSGLYDLRLKNRHDPHERVLNQDYYEAVQRTQVMFNENEEKIIANLAALSQQKKLKPELVLC